MKRLIFIYLLLMSMSISCQEHVGNEFKSIKEAAHDFFLEKEDFNKYLYDRYIKNGEGASIYGIHNKIDTLKIQDGIYWFTLGSHFKKHFLIYDNKDVEILDISSKKELKNSIKKTLEYSVKKDFCVQIINDYISRLIHTHYTVNKNPRTLLDVNCKLRSSPIVSPFNLKQLKIDLAEHLVNMNEIESINYFIKYPEFFIINNIEMYYGLSDDENINNGIYYFLNIEKENPKYFYVLINKGNYEIFDIDSFDNLNIVINKVLDLGDENKLCHERIKLIVQNLIDRYFSNSCFDDNLNVKLP